MKYYLTAFISRKLSDENMKYREIYPDSDSAKTRLESILAEKRNENWKIDILPQAEIDEDSGNVVYLVMGELSETLDYVIWVISTDEIPRMVDGEMFPEHEDITGVVNAREIAEKGFLPALIATIKMHPVASAGIGFFLFWLLFL